jgi:hypothetical protein
MTRSTRIRMRDLALLALILIALACIGKSLDLRAAQGRRERALGLNRVERVRSWGGHELPQDWPLPWPPVTGIRETVSTPESRPMPR